MRNKKRSKVNYLDLVPAPVPSLSFHQEGERVVLEIENRGAFTRIAQRLFHKPKTTYVHLDELGSFVWLRIDAARTVEDIATLVGEHFGDKADPLYPRLVQYFKNLETSGLVTLPRPKS